MSISRAKGLNLPERDFNEALQITTFWTPKLKHINSLFVKPLDAPLFGLKHSHFITTTKLIFFFFHLPLIVLGISLANHPLSWCHKIIPGLQRWFWASYPKQRKQHPPLGRHKKTVENPVFHFRNPNITLLAYYRSRYLVSNIENNLDGGPTNVLFISNQSSL